MNWLPDYNYILASKSPRRQMLLRSLGINFKVKIKEVDEFYPQGMPGTEIPVYLAKLKALPFSGELTENDLLITADTVVWLDNKVLGKPSDKEEAVEMLQLLSGKEHQVISGVCLTSTRNQKTFYSVSGVNFRELALQEIEYYIETCKPFDKAGAYGIQEWIGYIGITHIEGSFYNVMGLPVQQLYSEILNFEL
ncbi:MAG: septum formation protein Maf [Bacteroidales bacterium]|jgi:septum formation protein|nr:septum formation protein Maf [Bacteroidales bacterium]